MRPPRHYRSLVTPPGCCRLPEARCQFRTADAWIQRRDWSKSQSASRLGLLRMRCARGHAQRRSAAGVELAMQGPPERPCEVGAPPPQGRPFYLARRQTLDQRRPRFCGAWQKAGKIRPLMGVPFPCLATGLLADGEGGGTFAHSERICPAAAAHEFVLRTCSHLIICSLLTTSSSETPRLSRDRPLFLPRGTTVHVLHLRRRVT